MMRSADACRAQRRVRGRDPFKQRAGDAGQGLDAPLPTQEGWSIRAACVALVDELHAVFVLPSIYLLVDGRLRWQAARGYFRVVDGFSTDTGIIGRVVRTGVPVVLDDVRREPEFVAAIPGLVAEACVPVRVNGQVVGAISVESTTTLPADVVAMLEPSAARLAATIEASGGMPPVPLPQRLARIVVGLTSLTDRREIQEQALTGAIDVSGMDSAALSQISADRRWAVRHAAGPLASALRGWTHEQHQRIASWGGPGTSSHFAGGSGVPESHRFLLPAGVRAISVQPLVVRGKVTGLLTTAARCAVAHDPDTGAALELLAAQVGAALAMAAALAVLGERAAQDPLTGLRHAGAFAEDLERAAAATRRGADGGRACLLVDIDHFKRSTTPPGIRPATGCSVPWRTSSTRSCAGTTSCTGSVVTSSLRSSTPATSPRQRWSLRAWSRPLDARAPPCRWASRCWSRGTRP